MAQAIIDCADGKISVVPEETWKRSMSEAVMEKHLKGMGLEEDVL